MADLNDAASAEWSQILALSRQQPLPPPPEAAIEPGAGDRLLADAALSGPGAVDPSTPTTADDDVTGLLRRLRSGELDAAELMSQTLARLRAEPFGAVLALIDDAEEVAAISATRYRQGRARPLEGIAVAVKDIIDVQSAPVTCGSLQTGPRRASADATVVARLRQAGAIPVAMSATTEFACGSPENRRYGLVRNPWDVDRWTGGSSTGSAAALAGRLVPLALGTDTGGSIRVPSAWCGVTGLKPTRGLIPRTGVATLSWTLDHVGPMARSARDIVEILPLLWGPDGLDPHSVTNIPDSPAGSERRLRIGAVGGWFTEGCDPAVIAAWREALGVFEADGAEITEVDLGDLALTHQEAYLLLYCELASLQESRRDSFDLFDDGTQQRILRGQATAATDYLRALRRRPLVQRQLLHAMTDLDVLITPGMPTEAVSAVESHNRVYGGSAGAGVASLVHGAQARNTMLFDYTGFPAVMLPAGLGAAGLPVAIQIVGRPGSDLMCLSAAARFQQATNHHRLAPPAQRR